MLWYFLYWSITAERNVVVSQRCGLTLVPRFLIDEAEDELRRQQIRVRDDILQKIEKTIPNNNTHTTKQKRTHNGFLNTKIHQKCPLSTNP